MLRGTKRTSVAMTVQRRKMVKLSDPVALNHVKKRLIGRVYKNREPATMMFSSVALSNRLKPIYREPDLLTVTVEDVAKKFKQGKILIPEVQRPLNIGDIQRAAMYPTSVFTNPGSALSVPWVIYEDEKGNWHIYDGQHRFYYEMMTFMGAAPVCHVHPESEEHPNGFIDELPDSFAMEDGHQYGIRTLEKEFEPDSDDEDDSDQYVNQRKIMKTIKESPVFHEQPDCPDPKKNKKGLLVCPHDGMCYSLYWDEKVSDRFVSHKIAILVFKHSDGFTANHAAKCAFDRDMLGKKQDRHTSAMLTSGMRPLANLIRSTLKSGDLQLTNYPSLKKKMAVPTILLHVEKAIVLSEIIKNQSLDASSTSHYDRLSKVNSNPDGLFTELIKFDVSKANKCTIVNFLQRIPSFFQSLTKETRSVITKVTKEDSLVILLAMFYTGASTESMFAPLRVKESAKNFQRSIQNGKAGMGLETAYFKASKVFEAKIQTV